MIIGSSALKYWFPAFPRRPKDLDYVVYKGEEAPELNKILNYNNLRVEVLQNDVLLDYCLSKGVVTYCTPDILYTLKISHLFWDLENKSWDKHIWDVQWLKENGCEFIPELFYKLYDYWTELHGKRQTSNLEMSAKDFFDNAIKYPIGHDELHEILVRHPYFQGGEPTYKKVLKDGAEVDVDETKFNKLTELEKFNLVIEEVMVMAVERYNKLYYKAAFGRMLKKFILNHAPIWEGIWIIQNHKLLLNNIPFNFIEFIEGKK